MSMARGNENDIRMWRRAVLAGVAVVLGLASSTAFGQAVDQSIYVEEAGLITYNSVEARRGDIPVSVAYFRADGTHPEMYWTRLEPSPGQYDFSPFINALEEGRRKGIKVGIRIITANPHGRIFPGWIKSRTASKEGRTGIAPDWDDPAVQQSIRNLLVALGNRVKNHPAFLFCDIAALGWAGEWTTEWNMFRDADFMPTIESQRRYVDFHVEAFGAEKLVANLDMPIEILAYSMSLGVNGWRQDGFGNFIKSMSDYPPAFRDVPALWDVSGPRFFEIWGSNINEWPNQLVPWPIDQIFDEALKYRATMFANMGSPIPTQYVAAYKRFQRAMIDYAAK